MRPQIRAALQNGVSGGSRRLLGRQATGRLPPLDKQEYLTQVRAEVGRILDQVADVVNAAPDGKAINASEWQVHDLMEELSGVLI